MSKKLRKSQPGTIRLRDLQDSNSVEIPVWLLQAPELSYHSNFVGCSLEGETVYLTFGQGPPRLGPKSAVEVTLPLESCRKFLASLEPLRTRFSAAQRSEPAGLRADALEKIPHPAYTMKMASTARAASSDAQSTIDFYRLPSIHKGLLEAGVEELEIEPVLRVDLPSSAMKRFVEQLDELMQGGEENGTA